MKKICLAMITFLPMFLSAQGLEVIASGGLYLSRGGISIDATFGEVCVAHPSGKDRYASEGFQQGFIAGNELPGLATDRSEVSTELQAQLYPNPAVDRLEVQIKPSQNQQLRLKMFDARGKLIQESETASERCTFDLSALAPGPYWILLETPDQNLSISLPFSKINP